MNWKTVKRSYTKGFTLLETLVVLWILSSFTRFPVPHATGASEKETVALFISEYALEQSKALCYKEPVLFQKEAVISDYPITFNGKGNINISQTITYQADSETLTFVIWLGAGRIGQV